METDVRDDKGRFGKGNSGKPVGTKSERTKQWEQLAESIVGEQADRFRAHLSELWDSPDPSDRNQAAELYLKTLEYFKPKHARVMHAGDAQSPVQIIIPPTV
jgi:hypothetical protein